MSSGIAVVGSLTNGHDDCWPVHVVEGISWITIDGVQATAVGCRCEPHWCGEHEYHIPIISANDDDFLTADGIRIARVGDPVEWGGCPKGHYIATGHSLVSIDA